MLRLTLFSLRSTHSEGSVVRRSCCCLNLFMSYKKWSRRGWKCDLRIHLPQLHKAAWFHVLSDDKSTRTPVCSTFHPYLDHCISTSSYHTEHTVLGLIVPIYCAYLWKNQSQWINNQQKKQHQQQQRLESVVYCLYIIKVISFLTAITLRLWCFYDSLKTRTSILNQLRTNYLRFYIA